MSRAVKVKRPFKILGIAKDECMPPRWAVTIKVIDGAKVVVRVQADALFDFGAFRMNLLEQGDIMLHPRHDMAKAEWQELVGAAFASRQSPESKKGGSK